MLDARQASSQPTQTMSLPTAVFLDTSILAGQQYNFDSAALKSFVPVAVAQKLRLLLPDPTRREVIRQITERSIEALRALEGARRRAPFLAKWKSFPQLPENRGDWEVKSVALAEWRTFLKRFEVTELGYDGVKIETVMGWYDSTRSPFNSGKKRKEFPDAFAIAVLDAYASKTDTYVAVVAEDPDFRDACKYFPRLLYFNSLPSLTELLVSDTESISGIRVVVLAAEDRLLDAITEELGGLGFYHRDENFEDVEDVDWDEINLDDIRVVGLGGTDCTVVFEVGIVVRVTVKWSEYDRDAEYGSGRDYRSVKIKGRSQISGTAKLQFDTGRTVVEQVVFIELDQSEVELTGEPEDYSWR